MRTGIFLGVLWMASWSAAMQPEYVNLELIADSDDKERLHRVLLLPVDLQNKIKMYLIEAWFFDIFNPDVVHDDDLINLKGKGPHTISLSRDRQIILIRDILKQGKGDLVVEMTEHMINGSLLSPITQEHLLQSTFTIDQKKISTIKVKSSTSQPLFSVPSHDYTNKSGFIIPLGNLVFKGVVEHQSVPPHISKKWCVELQMFLYKKPHIGSKFTLKSLIAAFIKAKKGYTSLESDGKPHFLKGFFDKLDPSVKHCVKDPEQLSLVVQPQQSIKNKIKNLLKKE